MLAASSFSAGLALLPASLRGDAKRLYMMLRTLDDLVDEHHPHANKRVEAVERWAEHQPASSPETRTLSRLARSYPLSRTAVGDFCKGMRHDLTNTKINTDSDLERYCHYVAGTVGIMLAALLGTNHRLGPAKMAVLGRAMQRTNILRDIDEDLTQGRLYIPASAIERYGFPAPGAREALLKDQIARADKLYEQGIGAIPLLANGRRAMGLSAILYREILRQIEREGFGRKPGRATVPAWRRQLLASKYTLKPETEL